MAQARGMNAMTEKKMIHMDLALRNVLIHTNSLCKVADFGLTRIVDSDDGTFESVICFVLNLPLFLVDLRFPVFGHSCYLE
jgi:tRNA A-37 threonylcarbamoyl transferase component Bud32